MKDRITVLSFFTPTSKVQPSWLTLSIVKVWNSLSDLRVRLTGSPDLNVNEVGAKENEPLPPGSWRTTLLALAPATVCIDTAHAAGPVDLVANIPATKLTSSLGADGMASVLSGTGVVSGVHAETDTVTTLINTVRT